MTYEDCLIVSCSGFVRDQLRDVGLTQEELAKRIGVSKNTLTNWINSDFMGDIALKRDPELLSKFFEELEFTKEKRICFRKRCLMQRLSNPTQTKDTLYYVPPLPEGYVHRGIEDDIASALPDTHVVLHGMGGIGKTSIAIWIAKSDIIAKKFERVYWLECDALQRRRLDKEQWRSLLEIFSPRKRVLQAVLCKLFLPSYKGNTATCWQELMRSFQKRVLLILDDVPPKMDLAPVAELATKRNISILATTQYPDEVRRALWEVQSKRIELEKVKGMTIKQGTELVRRRHPDMQEEDEAILRDIGDLVGWHAGALRYVAFADVSEWKEIREELRGGELPDKIRFFVQRQIERAAGEDKDTIEALRVITWYGRYIDSLSMTAAMGRRSIEATDRKLKKLEKAGIVRDIGVLTEDPFKGIHLWLVEPLAYGEIRELGKPGNPTLDTVRYRIRSLKLLRDLYRNRELKRLLNPPWRFKIVSLGLIMILEVRYVFSLLLAQVSALPLVKKQHREFNPEEERKTFWSTSLEAHFSKKSWSTPAIFELIETGTIVYEYITLITALTILVTIRPFVLHVQSLLFSIVWISTDVGLLIFAFQSVGMLTVPIWIAYRINPNAREFEPLRKWVGRYL